MEGNQLYRDSPFKRKLYTIIFETETRAGNFFDLIVLYAILLSVMAVMLESVKSFEEYFGQYLTIVE